MDYINLTLSHEIEAKIENDKAALFYFSAPHCNVCKVLKPRLANLIQEEYPEFKLYYVDIDKAPMASGQFRVFSIPSILIYFDGKEYIRKSRNVSLVELGKELAKPYSLLFDE